jgi:hypothetical protein
MIVVIHAIWNRETGYLPIAAEIREIDDRYGCAVGLSITENALR